MLDYIDIKNDVQRMKDVTKMLNTLTEYMGADMVPNECDFIGIYGRVSTTKLTYQRS